MLFINNPNCKEVQEVMKENKEIKKATEKVEKMSEDEKLRRLAFLREKAIMDEKDIYRAGVDKGIEKGIAQGAKTEKIAMAKKMLSKSYSIEDIIDIDSKKITELDEEALEQYIENLKKELY